MRLEPVQWQALDAAQRAALLARPPQSTDDRLRAAVADIIAEVRARGDQALIEMAARFDAATLETLKVSNAEAAEAEATLSDAALAAIGLAISNVRRFHAAQQPAPIDIETMPGVRCQRISQPLDAVGLYVPAGTAPLPSAAIMLSVPAVLAQCPRIVVMTPPRADGRADPSVVVAARKAGVSEIYKSGGAQAVAALAYGTESVPRVVKIFGPGNSWVTMAKSLVANDPDGAAIDLPAGPSEVLVIADGNASAEFVASDLLSQAEHGTDSQVILVTDSKKLAESVSGQLDSQLESLSRADIAREALRHSRSILAADMAEAVDISNRYAPEHLILQVDQARDLLPGIRNAGSVFVGRWTPESVGDYCSGTNHVLPTYGFARNYSGLGLDQFLRQMTIQELTRDGLASLGDAVVELASLEGLDAHAQAVTRRLRQPQ